MWEKIQKLAMMFAACFCAAALLAPLVQQQIMVNAAGESPNQKCQICGENSGYSPVCKLCKIRQHKESLRREEDMFIPSR